MPGIPTIADHAVGSPASRVNSRLVAPLPQHADHRPAGQAAAGQHRGERLGHRQHARRTEAQVGGGLRVEAATQLTQDPLPVLVPAGIAGQRFEHLFENRSAGLPCQSEATQRRSTSAPASPDFSGWNWVADSGPFSTAATNRSPPCSAQVTTGGVNGRVTSSSHRRTA